MPDQFTNPEDGEIALPTSSLDLSTRMRELRARQGLMQSEVARRMRLDPSVLSCWERGVSLVPVNRVRALADALEVTVEELLDGISGTARTPKADSTVEARPTPLTRLGTWAVGLFPRECMCDDPINILVDMRQQWADEHFGPLRMAADVLDLPVQGLRVRARAVARAIFRAAQIRGRLR
jgi:transcriptional regulator with XRE-family HTH domain